MGEHADRQHEPKPSTPTPMSASTARSAGRDIPGDLANGVTVAPTGLTSGAVRQLQAVHGNQAVQRLLTRARDDVAAPDLPRLHDPDHRIRRAPVVADKKGAVTWEEALQVMQGIINIVNKYWEKRDTPPYSVPKTHPQHQDVPSKYMDLLDEWFYIANPKVRLKSGAIISYRGPFLTEHINQAMKETAPLIKALIAEGDDTTKPWLASEFYKPVQAFRERALHEEATDLVTETAGRLGTVLDPMTALDARQAGELIDLTLSSVSNLGNLIDVRADIIDKIDGEIDEILRKHPLPKPLAQNLKGLSAIDAVGELGTILGAVKDILEIADSNARAKMFNQKLGAWGTVQGVTDIIAKGLSITQGVTSAACLLTAAVSRAAGYTDAALQLLKASSSITSFTGYLGKAVGVLSIIKGSISVLHPESSGTERASGVADIALGTAAITGGALGLTLSGAALSFKVNLAILEAGVGASRGLVWWDLSKCYRSMAKWGELIARNANRVIAGLALIAAEPDPIRKRYLWAEVNEAARYLRIFIGGLLKDSTDVYYPGAWTPLRKRLRRAGKPPSPKTSPAALVKQAESVLTILQDIFAKRDTILNEATKEAWEKHG